MKYLKKICFSNILLLIVCLLFFLRLYALDADLTSWGKTLYQPVDEGAYGILAIQNYKFGDLNPIIPEMNSFVAPHVRTNLIGNLITYIGLNLLGNNYYGFRIGSFVCMMINMVLNFLIFTSIQKKYGITSEISNRFKSIRLCFIFYFVLEFNYLLASRVVETSVYRLLILNLIMYTYIKFKSNKSFFFLGFFSMFSVTGVYITNIFIFVAVSIVVFLDILFEKRDIAIKRILCYLLGCLSAYIICDLYLLYFWDTTFIENTLSSITSFSAYSEYATTNSLYLLFQKAFHFFSSNFNLYNLSILFLFLISFPFTLKNALREKDRFTILMFLIYILFFLQTLISEDFILRKYIIVALIPIFILYRYLCSSSKEKIYNFIKSQNIFYIFACFIFCIFILLYRLKFISDGTALDFSRQDKYVIFGFSVLSISFLFLLLCKIKYINRLNYMSTIFIFIMSVFSSVFLNVYMDVTNVYNNNLTYDDKNIMLDLNHFIGDNEKFKYIVGAYAHSYSLYNDMLPIIDNYEEMMDNLINNNNIYYFDYSTNWNVGFGTYINSILNPKGYELYMVKEYPRSYQAMGVNRGMAIYKIRKIQ